MDISFQETVQDFNSQGNTELEICNIKKVDAYCSKIQFSSGPSFFISQKYFHLISPEEIYEGNFLSGEKLSELIHTGFCYTVEQAALAYLNRAEQCRQGLETKLYKKNYDSMVVKEVLDVLEAEGYLDDSRFAQAWIRNRMISHCEGKTKLLAELSLRGINRHVAQKAVEEYFSLVPEEEIFQKALNKCKRLGYDNEKMIKKLLNQGFSYNFIKKNL